MINFKLNEIVTFLTVAELQSFRAAAERLNVSQSTVSVRVRQLEDALGIRLFQRTTRQVRLTDGGVRLLAAARETLSELSKLSTQLRDEGALKQGRVTVAALPSVAATVLPGVLAGFGRLHPKIRVSVLDCVAERAEAAVFAGDAALALTSAPSPQRGFAFEPLFRDECLIVAPRNHPLSERQAVRLDELVDCPLLVPVRGSGFRHDIDAMFSAAGVTLRPEREGNNLATLIAYAETGMGVTFVPAIFTQRLDLSRCRTVRIAPEPFYRSMGIATRFDQPMKPAAMAFADYLRAELADGLPQPSAGLVAT